MINFVMNENNPVGQVDYKSNLLQYYRVINFIKPFEKLSSVFVRFFNLPIHADSFIIAC